MKKEMRAVKVILLCAIVVLFGFQGCGGGGGDEGNAGELSGSETVADSRLVGMWDYETEPRSHTRSGHWYFSDNGKVYAQGLNTNRDKVDRCVYMGTYTFEADGLVITGVNPYTAVNGTLYSGPVRFEGSNWILTDETKMDGEDWGDYTFEPSALTPLTEGCTALVAE